MTELKRLTYALQCSVYAHQNQDGSTGYDALERGVRAVLQAMREPSEGMEAVGQKELRDCADPYDGPAIAEYSAAECWQAMIDHILAGGE